MEKKNVFCYHSMAAGFLPIFCLIVIFWWKMRARDETPFFVHLLLIPSPFLVPTKGPEKKKYKFYGLNIMIRRE